MSICPKKVSIAPTGRLAGVLLLTTVLGGGMAPPATLAKSRVSYKPGISLVTEILQSNGQQRAYNTPNGPALWTNSLPILQGDRIKLNVFAATGGADLARVIVRLDNVKYAQFTKAPWNTVLDTSKMATGYHMVEVFAETNGDRPQSDTKTLTFNIAQKLAPQYAVQQANVQYQGSQQQNGGPEIDPATNPNAVPDVPEFLKGQSVDENATVIVRARSGISPADPTKGGSTVGDTPVVINEPTLLFIEPAPGSSAKNYAFALVRNGQVIMASTEPQELIYNAIKIEKRTATTPGLGSGTLTMYVWGIDDQKRPSNPVKTQISIP